MLRQSIIRLLELNSLTLLKTIDMMGIDYEGYLEYLDDQHEIHEVLSQTPYLLEQYLELDDSEAISLLPFYEKYSILLNDFYNKMKALENKNPEIIKKLLSMFLDHEEKTFRGLFASIKKYPKHFNMLIKSNKFKKEDKDKINMLIEQASNLYNSFMSEYYSHRIIDGHQLTNTSLQLAKQQQKNDYQQASSCKPLIYLDQNIISGFIEGKFPIYTLREEYQFTFSQAAISDSLKMHSFFFKNHIDKLIELTNGFCIENINGKLNFVIEHSENILSRAKSLIEYTEYSEETAVFKKKYSFHRFPQFRNGSSISNNIQRNPITFFKNIEKEKEVFELFDSPSKYFDITLQELKNNKIDISNKKDDEIIRLIEIIYTTLDILNFKTHPINDHKLLKSSYQDMQHLIYAWKADYFLTEDQNLLERAKYIYQLLGIKTKPHTVQSLIEELNKDKEK